MKTKKEPIASETNSLLSNSIINLAKISFVSRNNEDDYKEYKKIELENELVISTLLGENKKFWSSFFKKIMCCRKKNNFLEFQRTKQIIKPILFDLGYGRSQDHLLPQMKLYTSSYLKNDSELQKKLNIEGLCMGLTTLWLLEQLNKDLNFSNKIHFSDPLRFLANWDGEKNISFDQQQSIEGLIKSVTYFQHLKPLDSHIEDFTKEKEKEGYQKEQLDSLINLIKKTYDEKPACFQVSQIRKKTK